MASDPKGMFRQRDGTIHFQPGSSDKEYTLNTYTIVCRATGSDPCWVLDRADCTVSPGRVYYGAGRGHHNVAVYGDRFADTQSEMIDVYWTQADADEALAARVQ